MPAFLCGMTPIQPQDFSLHRQSVLNLHAGGWKWCVMLYFCPADYFCLPMCLVFKSIFLGILNKTACVLCRWHHESNQ